MRVFIPSPLPFNVARGYHEMEGRLVSKVQQWMHNDLFKFNSNRMGTAFDT